MQEVNDAFNERWSVPQPREPGDGCLNVDYQAKEPGVGCINTADKGKLIINYAYTVGELMDLLKNFDPDTKVVSIEDEFIYIEKWSNEDSITIC